MTKYVVLTMRDGNWRTLLGHPLADVFDSIKDAEAAILRYGDEEEAYRIGVLGIRRIESQQSKRLVVV